MDELYNNNPWGNNPINPPTGIQAGINILFGSGGYRALFKVGANYNNDYDQGSFNAAIGYSASYNSKNYTAGKNGWNHQAKVGFDVNHIEDDLTASYGFEAAYSSNFYETGKSGFGLRNSLKLGFDDDTTGVGLGTNLWTGLGEMSEFNQRTGIMSYKHNDFRFSYENDGTPFQWLGLGDGGDSYRTAAACLGYGDFSVLMNLFTGYRGKGRVNKNGVDYINSFDYEDEIDENQGIVGGLPFYGYEIGKGKFDEEYKHAPVREQGPKYRYGGLVFNYNGISQGYNAEMIRHIFQNKFAHEIMSPQRQFPMLSNDWKDVFNYQENKCANKFSLWD